jgi:hypothetical protein
VKLEARHAGGEVTRQQGIQDGDSFRRPPLPRSLTDPAKERIGRHLRSFEQASTKTFFAASRAILSRRLRDGLSDNLLRMHLHFPVIIAVSAYSRFIQNS